MSGTLPIVTDARIVSFTGGSKTTRPCGTGGGFNSAGVLLEVIRTVTSVRHTSVKDRRLNPWVLRGFASFCGSSEGSMWLQDTT